MLSRYDQDIIKILRVKELTVALEVPETWTAGSQVGERGWEENHLNSFHILIICNLLQDNLIFTSVPDIWVKNTRGHKILLHWNGGNIISHDLFSGLDTKHTIVNCKIRWRRQKLSHECQRSQGEQVWAIVHSFFNFKIFSNRDEKQKYSFRINLHVFYLFDWHYFQLS